MKFARSFLLRIRVIALVAVTIFCPCVAQHARAASTVTLAWDPNPEPEVSKYRVYYGPSTGIYTGSVDVINQTSTTLSTLPAGAYVAAVSAWNGAAESNLSSEVSFLITASGPSTNANLSALSMSVGTLSPAFSSATTAYSASVSNATSSITVTPTVADATATVKVNGVTVASGSASAAQNLIVGANPISVVVTAGDASTTKTYTVTVTRAASANANLASLVPSAGTLSPAFASGTTSYSANVSNGTTSITVTPTVSDATASV